MIRILFVLLLTVGAAGCSKSGGVPQVFAGQQSYADALATYTAERAELTRLEAEKAKLDEAFEESQARSRAQIAGGLDDVAAAAPSQARDELAREIDELERMHKKEQVDYHNRSESLAKEIARQSIRVEDAKSARDSARN